MKDIDNKLHDRTIDYLLTLRKDQTVKKSEYHQIFVMLCDMILREDEDKIETELENAEQLKQKCGSCGEPLETWEREICGPCKIKDPRFEEESDE